MVRCVVCEQVIVYLDGHLTVCPVRVDDRIEMVAENRVGFFTHIVHTDALVALTIEATATLAA